MIVALLVAGCGSDPAADTAADPSPTAIQPAPATGLLTFRGDATRSEYGTGPVPAAPAVVWSNTGLCGGDGECGTAWASQPTVVERDGRTWVVTGAYDGAVHFWDAADGADVLPPFVVGAPVKGTVTIDPDGYPLVAFGAQDGRLRVVAIDGDAPRGLWELPADAVEPTLFSTDWDAAPLLVDDLLFEGGENGQLHVVRLNRSGGGDEPVAVDPELVFSAPTWDDELLAAIGDENVSVETSAALDGATLWIANSGGLVQGWDVGGLLGGPGETPPSIAAEIWVGDDVDASPVIGSDGAVYVAASFERPTDRARAVGQLLRLDPARPDPPIWSVPDQDAARAGFLATPALHDGVLFAPTVGGRLLAVEAATGAVLWSKQLAGHVWGSPAVVDDVLIQGDCAGVLRGYDVSDPRVEPPELWSVQLDGCIESTPAVWKGRIYVGTRAGTFYALG